VSGPRIAVVTDSTSYLPRGWAADLGIGVVPVQVIVAGQPFDETDHDQAQRVAEALEAWRPVTTSRPSPTRFLQAYEAAAAAGAEEIVVATLSASMSATFESALLAAKEFDRPVRVVDSRSIAMGLGFAVVSGAEAARQGLGAERVAAIVEERARAASVYFYVDTLEYLRRGGRVSSARAAVGHALQVKPLLTVDDGHVVRLEQVRTAGRALSRLEELAVAAAEGSDVDVAVQHLGADARAGDLAERLRARLPDVSVAECKVGGVVGAHVGPGMVSVVVAPKPDLGRASAHTGV
jgi:DegV family protein with EDD domain